MIIASNFAWTWVKLDQLHELPLIDLVKSSDKRTCNLILIIKLCLIISFLISHIIFSTRADCSLTKKNQFQVSNQRSFEFILLLELILLARWKKQTEQQKPHSCTNSIDHLINTHDPSIRENGRHIQQAFIAPIGVIIMYELLLSSPLFTLKFK